MRVTHRGRHIKIIGGPTSFPPLRSLPSFPPFLPLPFSSLPSLSFPSLPLPLEVGPLFPSPPLPSRPSPSP